MVHFRSYVNVCQEGIVGIEWVNNDNVRIVVIPGSTAQGGGGSFKIGNP